MKKSEYRAIGFERGKVYLIKFNKANCRHEEIRHILDEFKRFRIEVVVVPVWEEKDIMVQVQEKRKL